MPDDLAVVGASRDLFAGAELLQTRLVAIDGHVVGDVAEAAVLLFPLLGHLLRMSSHAFGLWSGTAINDTSSVVAASFAYSHSAGTYAVIVKLTRTTMIIPITLYLATRMFRRSAAAQTGVENRAPAPTTWTSMRRIMPWFLVWFLAASAANSLGASDPGARAAFSHLGLALTTLVLVWIAVATTSLALQALTGAL